ncbi:unnamed protein product [Ectocarpus fasciculatus]
MGCHQEQPKLRIAVPKSLESNLRKFQHVAGLNARDTRESAIITRMYPTKNEHSIPTECTRIYELQHISVRKQPTSHTTLLLAVCIRIYINILQPQQPALQGQTTHQEISWDKIDDALVDQIGVRYDRLLQIDRGLSSAGYCRH